MFLTCSGNLDSWYEKKDLKNLSHASPHSYTRWCCEEIKKHVGGRSIPDIVQAFGKRQEMMRQEQVIDSTPDCQTQRKTDRNTHGE